jgi:hypothetical protein
MYTSVLTVQPVTAPEVPRRRKYSCILYEIIIVIIILEFGVQPVAVDITMRSRPYNEQ